MSYLGRNEGEGGISRGKGKQIVQSGLFMGPTRSPVPDHCSLGHNNNFTASVAPTVGGPGVSNLALAGASGPLLLAVMGRWCHHYPLLPLQWAMKNTNLLCITSSDGNLQNWNVLTTLFFFFSVLSQLATTVHSPHPKRTKSMRKPPDTWYIWNSLPPPHGNQAFEGRSWQLLLGFSHHGKVWWRKPRQELQLHFSPVSHLCTPGTHSHSHRNNILKISKPI